MDSDKILVSFTLDMDGSMEPDDDGNGEWVRHYDAAALIRQLTAERDAAREALARALEDAERYQRVRLGLSEKHGDVYAMVFGEEGDYPLMGPPLDTAIDAARNRHE